MPHQPSSLRPSGLSTLGSGIIDQDDDGALSAPEFASIRRDRGKFLVFLLNTKLQTLLLQ